MHEPPGPMVIYGLGLSYSILDSSSVSTQATNCSYFVELHPLLTVVASLCPSLYGSPALLLCN